jgi:hypothetical protein
MKYQKAVNIWFLTSEQRKALKVGQWVVAGDARGQYMGQKNPSSKTNLGIDVVVWHHQGMAGYTSKRSALRDYATGQRRASA